MGDEKLIFPMLLGLDFITKSDTMLDVWRMEYGVETPAGRKIFPFLTDPFWEQGQKQEERRPEKNCFNTSVYLLVKDTNTLPIP